jgi:histidinol dehydrogenase
LTALSKLTPGKAQQRFDTSPQAGTRQLNNNQIVVPGNNPAHIDGTGTMSEINQLSTANNDFWKRLDQLLAWESVSDAGINDTVNQVIRDVRAKGDAALIDFTYRFDRWQAQSTADLEIPPERLEQAWKAIPAEQREALQISANRINAYAEHQIMDSWNYTEPDGTLLGQQVTPLERVGLYVPGGKAAYPSSVLMNAIPAKVAGVGELIMVVPTPNGEANELVLAAAHVSNIDRVFAIGGAQAVAALAYGTESIPPVDKIVGPGNIYVASAKRAVFGQVGIDMVAGPSEILIICDGETNPDWIAMDLFSQAEHDEDAQSILVCPDAAFIGHVSASIDRLLPTMERREIIKTSLQARGALIHVKDMDEAVEVANHIAPEHLELSVANPLDLAKRIKHAGAIFMGRHTAEAMGDYCAGPNHVLPTSRTARFSSPLGVYDFQKRSSLIMASPEGADTLAHTSSVMARGEGLTAHARSAEFRFKPE